MIAVLLYLALHASSDGAALERTAPGEITRERAIRHVAAAEIAGWRYDVDPNLLLSIAWHESRYHVAEATPEVHGVSCGVMTPEPIAHCPAPSLLGGYLAGAEHVAAWRDACHGEMACALTGYAGGYHLLALCGQEHVRACDTWRVFQARAAWIARERARGDS